MILAIIALPWLGGSQAEADSSWRIRTVDGRGDPGDSVSDNSVVLDSDGYPHISYGSTIHEIVDLGRPPHSKASLKYATWNGFYWDIQTVDRGGLVGTDPSLVVDAMGFVHIIYYDSTNKHLKHALWVGLSWDVQTIESFGAPGTATALTVDSDGPVRVSFYSYHNPTSGNLKYGSWNGYSWEIEAVDAPPHMSGRTSLALAGSGPPHISYQVIDWGDPYGPTTYLKYAAWNGVDWDIQTVDSLGRAGIGVGGPCLVLDSRDYPHISYYDGSSRWLKYAVWNGSFWDIQTVDNTNHSLLRNVLTLDAKSRPHLAYEDSGPRVAPPKGVIGIDHPDVVHYDSRNVELKYAAWNGSLWEIQTVDKGVWGWDISLAVDSNGHAHISYSSSKGHLKYATNAPEPFAVPEVKHVSVPTRLLPWVTSGH